jgi:hypothetical protein
MEEKHIFESLAGDVKKYIETRISLAKLQAVEQGSRIAGSIMTAVIAVIVFSLFLIFASIAVAFLISESTGKGYMGFVYVGGFYLLLGIIILLMKEKLIIGPVTNSFIRKILKDNDDEDK